MRTAPAIATALLALAVASCGSSSGSATAPGSPPSTKNGAGTKDGKGASGGSLAGGGQCTDSAAEGCPCSGTDQSAACWTGPAGDRHRGACHDGTTKCVQHGEFFTWGPCEDEELTCGSAPAPSDAGNGGGGNEGTHDNPVGCPPLSVGGLHACAVTKAGGLKCWGWNAAGQLGNGSTDSTTSPVDVVGLTSGVACVAAGESNTCALTTGGAVKCWGTGFNSNVPVDVPGLSSGVTAIASGEFDTCAVLANGSVSCWGQGGEDEKDPITNYGNTPVKISGIPSDLLAVQASDGFNCLLTKGGAVQCWGGNSVGELGNGTTAPSATPVPVTGLGSGVTWLSANGGTAACVIVNGHLKCWGNGNMTPTDVPGLTSGATAVSIGGESYGCALMADTSVHCWGNKDYSDAAPIGLSSAVYVVANEGCSCAILSSGKISCWGLTLPAIGGTGSCLGDGKPPPGGFSPPVEVVGL